MARRIMVEVTGDSRQLERAFARSSRSATRFKRDIDRTFRGGLSAGFRGIGRQVAFASSAFLGGAGLVAAIRTSISAASDLEEQIAKTDVVFQDSAASVEAWAKTTTDSAGLAEAAALGISSSFGALFRPLGIGPKQAASFSMALTQLGADLASFYNTDVQDALDAIQSGLVGQVRPLRRYAVQLSAARVEAVALAATGKRTKAELTDQEKVLARLAIIFKDTGLAQGDFARTQGHLANQQRILQANVQRFQEALGTVLIPMVTRIVRRLNEWLGSERNVHNLTERFQRVVEVLGRTAQTTAGLIGGLVGAVGGWGNALTIAIGAWAGFKVAGVGAATAVTAANLVAAGAVESAWKAALISTGWGVFAIAAGIAAAYVITHWEKVKLWFEQFWVDLKIGAVKTALDIAEPFSHLPRHAGQWARDLKEEWQGNLAGLREDAAKTRAALDALDRRGPKPPAGARGPVGLPERRPRLPRFVMPDLSGRGGGPTAEDLAKQSAQAIERLQLGIDQAEMTRGFRDDLAALQKLQDYLQRRIKVERKNLDLRRQLLGVQQQIADTLKEQAEQREAARTARQFRLLGLGPTGEELIPGVKALQKQLNSVRDTIAGSFLDTRKTRGLLGHIRQILSGGLGSVSAEVRSKVAQILADLKGQLRQSSVDVTRFQKTARGQFTLAGAAPGPRTLVVQGGLHLHGVQNVQQLENELARRAKQRAHARRSTR